MKKRRSVVVICIIVILFLVYIGVHFFPFSIHYPAHAIISLWGDRVNPDKPVQTESFRTYLTEAESESILALLPARTSGISGVGVAYYESGKFVCLEIHDPQKGVQAIGATAWFYLDLADPSRSLYQYESDGFPEQLRWYYKLQNPDELIELLCTSQQILDTITKKLCLKALEV